MGRKEKIIIFLLTLVSWCLGGEKSFSACPGDPSFDRRTVIHFSGEALAPVYRHDLTTAQIEAMRHRGSWRGGMHNPGLTIARHEVKSSSQIGGLRKGRTGEVCVWVDSLQVDFRFTQMEVYLSRQYAEGSCPYGVILDHENQHVAINTRVFRKYQALLGAALDRDRTIPTRGKPLSVRSMAQGKALISARINRLVKPLEARFVREVEAENARIDTPANYRHTQAKCMDW